MMSTIVEYDKGKIGVLNEAKDELREFGSKFKSTCFSVNEDFSVSNWSTLVAEMLNSLFNPTFIHNLKSSINHAHSGDNELK